jgi:hypothetical protein
VVGGFWGIGGEGLSFTQVWSGMGLGQVHLGSSGCLVKCYASNAGMLRPYRAALWCIFVDAWVHAGPDVFARASWNRKSTVLNACLCCGVLCRAVLCFAGMSMAASI